MNGGEPGDALVTVKIALVDEAPPSEAKYDDLPADDPEAARLFIKLVAQRGDAEAQYNLARFYKLGRGGLPKDKQEAERLFKLAADQGHAAAQKELFDAAFAHLEKLSRRGRRTLEPRGVRPLEFRELLRWRAPWGNATIKTASAGISDHILPSAAWNLVACGVGAIAELLASCLAKPHSRRARF